MYFELLVAGFFGGVIRGLVGFVKHQFSYKQVPFNLSYFLGMSFVSGVIGMMAAISIREIGFTAQGAFSPALSFIVGYAGGDFIENIYKILAAKFSLPLLSKEPNQKK